MKIITVSRQFYSGGRDFARELAKTLGFDFYDKAIITEIAQKTELDEKFVKDNLEKGFSAYPTHFGRGSYYSPIINTAAINVAVAQREIIKSIAERGNAVIVGRGADVILKEYNTLNLFVYRDIEERIQRYRLSFNDDDSDRRIKNKLLAVDRERARCREMTTDTKWGDKDCYHLMINLTGLNDRSVVKAVAQYATEWFDEK